LPEAPASAERIARSGDCQMMVAESGGGEICVLPRWNFPAAVPGYDKLL